MTKRKEKEGWKEGTISTSSIRRNESRKPARKVRKRMEGREDFDKLNPAE
jgi:hypothetical protein